MIIYSIDRPKEDNEKKGRFHKLEIETIHAIFKVPNIAGQI